MNKFVVCITGGIASGKTFVSDQMTKAGFYVVDADVVARMLVDKGQPTLDLLVNNFGSSILLENGNLNREKMKSMVFKDRKKLSLLNQIIHPPIQNEMLKLINTSPDTCVVLVIPLFHPSMVAFYNINRVMVVDVDRQIQTNRVMQRDGVNFSLAKKIIQSQLDRDDRLSYGTDVIVNNGSLDEFRISIGFMINYFQKSSTVFL